MDGKNNTIAIVGAGMAGLACASELAKAGRQVALYDKGRGPGGRMSTRRAEAGGEPLRFDHGAQYFTARDPHFLEQVRAWESDGVVARWPAAGEDAWVGVPGMNAPIRAMAERADVAWAHRIESLQRDGDRLLVRGEGKVFSCDAFVCAVPAEQAAVLLADAAPDLAAIASKAHSEPCWAVMAAFDERLASETDTYRSENGPIAWAARNSAKPGRAGPEAWVIHASPARTKELLEEPRDAVADVLLADFFAATGIAPTRPSHLAAHRWLYAMPHARGGEPCQWDDVRRIGLCGDYLHSPRVEGAFLSGRALARSILGDAAK